MSSPADNRSRARWRWALLIAVAIVVVIWLFYPRDAAPPEQVLDEATGQIDPGRESPPATPD